MSNQSVIVCTGNTSKKFFNDEANRVEVTPFVGQDCMGQFGVGLFVTRADGTKQSWTWGLAMPRYLIQSWRAMKLLEEMPRIELDGSPCRCWNLANEKLYGGDDKYLDKEGALYGDYEKFREARAKILAMFPTDEEIKAMLAVVDEHKIDIDVEEIEEKRNNLSNAPGILKRLCIADDIRRERDRLEAEARAKRQAERPKIPDAVILPKRRSLFRRLFG